MTTDGRESTPDPTNGEDSRPSASSDDGAQRAAGRGRAGRSRRKPLMPLWLESIVLLVFALAAAVVIKTFLAQAFYIPSVSMEPGLVENDRIVVQKVSYWGGGTPERGDVVVFKDPGGWLGASDSAEPGNLMVKAMSKIGLYPTGGHLVKRVIGVGGDTVECCDEQGRLMVNGEPIDEPYIRMPRSGCAGPVYGCKGSWSSGKIPEGHIFVMGDNRGESADSSRHMCRKDYETDCVSGSEFVPVDLVVGKVFVLLWPANHFRWIGTADAFADVPEPQ